MIHLFRKKSKCGRYTDYYLMWQHNGKTYKVYVKPSFSKDYQLMFAQSANAEDSAY